MISLPLELFHETLYPQDALWKNGSIVEIYEKQCALS